MRDFKEYVLWNAVTPQAVTSSTDATPIVVTKAAHGYSTGDVVMINGHTTNIAANGIFKVTRLTSSTFSLQNYITGENIVGSGAGAGSGGVVVVAPKILLVEDFTNIIISVVTSSSFNGTFKVAGSLGKPVVLATDKYSEDTPNFSATQSASNPYTFLQIVNLDTGAKVDGAIGVTSAGTDLNNTYEVNINAVKYLTLVLTAWTAGVITVKAQLTDNQ
jgi:hypothetical protein